MGEHSTEQVLREALQDLAQVEAMLDRYLYQASARSFVIGREKLVDFEARIAKVQGALRQVRNATPAVATPEVPPPDPLAQVRRMLDEEIAECERAAVNFSTSTERGLREGASPNAIADSGTRHSDALWKRALYLALKDRIAEMESARS